MSLMKKKKKNLFSRNKIDRTIHEIIKKIASLFQEDCQKGQKGHKCWQMPATENERPENVGSENAGVDNVNNQMFGLDNVLFTY